MKKLMFALVAAGAAAVMGDAIESQNIVGYTVKTNVAWSILGPDFIACNGTEDMTLNDLAVTCDEEDPEATTGWLAMGDSICVLTSAGNAGPALVYVPQWLATGITEESGGELVVTRGWYNQTAAYDGDYSSPCNSQSIEFGKGILVNISSGFSGAGINFSGQVKTAPTITDVENWMPLVNCAPKNIKLIDVKVNCDEEDPEATTGWLAMGDSICMLTSAGNAGPALVYVPQWLATGITEESGGELVVTRGWYNQTAAYDGDYSSPLNNDDVLAGEGFLVNASSGFDDITVQIDPAITVTP